MNGMAEKLSWKAWLRAIECRRDTVAGQGDFGDQARFFAIIHP
jgi:hypothetical protein